MRGEVMMAEEGGFEPPVRVDPARLFSKQLVSATHPLLLIIIPVLRNTSAPLFRGAGFNSVDGALNPEKCHYLGHLSMKIQKLTF
jgi:hypothetical protein